MLPTNARQLYGTQGNELGLAADLQGRYFSQLTWLGMPREPPIATVVAHLKHCAETGSEMNPDVYRVLSNSADQQAVRQLRGTPCVQVGRWPLCLAGDRVLAAVTFRAAGARPSRRPGSRTSRSSMRRREARTRTG